MRIPIRAILWVRTIDIFSSIITPGKEFYSKEGSKYELEGLTFKGNDLYTTVMTGTKGKNIKRLYKILEVKE